MKSLLTAMTIATITSGGGLAGASSTAASRVKIDSGVLRSVPSNASASCRAEIWDR